MQVYVQKSTRTTFPRRPSLVSGCELSHPVAPPGDGNSPSTGRRAMVAASNAASRLMWPTRRLRRQPWQRHLELVEVVPVFGVPARAALRREVILVPPPQFSRWRQWLQVRLETGDQITAHGDERLAPFRPERREDGGRP